MMFASKEQLESVTGHRTKAAQIAWLKENHIKYYINANGDPIVAKAKLDKRVSAVRYTSRRIMPTTDEMLSENNGTRFSRNEVGIYILMKADSVIYVGKTSNLFARIAQHQADKDFDSVQFIRCDESLLDLYERELIATLNPSLNKAGIFPQSSFRQK
jgi:hypothetical protein